MTVTESYTHRDRFGEDLGFESGELTLSMTPMSHHGLGVAGSGEFDLQLCSHTPTDERTNQRTSAAAPLPRCTCPPLTHSLTHSLNSHSISSVVPWLCAQLTPHIDCSCDSAPLLCLCTVRRLSSYPASSQQSRFASLLCSLQPLSLSLSPSWSCSARLVRARAIVLACPCLLWLSCALLD